MIYYLMLVWLTSENSVGELVLCMWTVTVRS